MAFHCWFCVLLYPSDPEPYRPGSVQPLLTENTTLPIPVPNSTFGPTAPISPISSYGISPRSSVGNLPNYQGGSSPVSPRSSISSCLPMEAAAAVEAQDKDEDIALEIPWRKIKTKCMTSVTTVSAYGVTT